MWMYECVRARVRVRVDFWRNIYTEVVDFWRNILYTVYSSPPKEK